MGTIKWPISFAEADNTTFCCGVCIILMIAQKMGPGMQAQSLDLPVTLLEVL